MNEFELIQTYFGSQPVVRSDVRLGIGDDAALVNVPADHELVVTTDMLVAARHFPELTDPGSVGYKALAVNLSDLAAMAADPRWFTLNLSLPDADTAWLRAFSAGMFELARQHDVALIGGDTTRGPLAVGIQMLGTVPRSKALTRSGARPGDRVYVTGDLGDAALGLMLVEGRMAVPEAYQAQVVAKLNRPVPRIAAGLALRDVASAGIDISDGLAADLGHILAASGVGARIELARLPRSPAYDSVFAQIGWGPMLSGGDDYELCFTVSPAKVDQLGRTAARMGVPFHEIGQIESGTGLQIFDERGQRYKIDTPGFDHFR